MNSHHIPSIRSSNNIKNNFFYYYYSSEDEKEERKVFINRINKEKKCEVKEEKSFPFLMLSSDIFLSFRNWYVIRGVKREKMDIDKRRQYGIQNKRIEWKVCGMILG